MPALFLGWAEERRLLGGSRKCLCRSRALWVRSDSAIVILNTDSSTQVSKLLRPPTGVVPVWKQFTWKYQEENFWKTYDIRASHWCHGRWGDPLWGHGWGWLRCLCESRAPSTTRKTSSCVSSTQNRRTVLRDGVWLIFMFLKNNLFSAAIPVSKRLWRGGLIEDDQ